MKKNKKIIKYILAFAIPLVICLGVLYFKNVFQNIENIFVTDLRTQHFAFLNYLKNVLQGNSSIFYTFFAGIGNSMISTIIFYCISPFNLLLLLFEDIRFAILFIYITKVCLSGLTMYILLKSKSKTDNFVTLLFSTCYALSSFVINYFFCVFWFDSLYLAPLVMLGIDKIIKNEKINLLYIFSLTLAIICNIQMGFGLCIYSLVYYLYSYNINYTFKNDSKKFKQLSIIFIISSLCAGAISSAALLGFGLDYGNIAAARSIEITTSTGTSHLGYVFKNLFTIGNLKDNFFNNFEPFIYCGLIVTFFSILYFSNKEIDKKKKTSALLVILFFIISFSIKPLNLFWHLSSPVLLNFRYSIYLGLFLTTLAYESYLIKQKITGKDIVLLSIFIIIGLAMIVGYYQEVYILWSLIFIALIFILILLSKNKNKKIEILLFIVILAEIFTNCYLSLHTAEDIPYGKYSSYEDLLTMSKYAKYDDNYRIINNYTYTEYLNDGMLLNNHSSLRYFSSIINGNVVNFLDRNGSAVGNNNYNLSAYDSPLTLSLMGTKYLYLNEELNNSIYNKIDAFEITSYNYETKQNETHNIYVYENPYALSLGYIIENDVDYNKSASLHEYQNNIIKGFTGNDKDVIIPLEFTQVSDTSRCQNLGNCVAYDINNHTNNVLVYIYGTFEGYNISNISKFFSDTSRPLLITSVSKNIQIDVGSFNYYPGIFGVTTYNKNNLIESLNLLKENMLENIEINKNILTGNINSSKNGILLLTIPYDKNFKIYVDNNEVNYYSLLNDSFIGVDIQEGNHTIKLEYIDGKYKWYLLSSTISIIITLILYYFINKKIKKRKDEELKRKIELENQKKAKEIKKKEKNKKNKSKK